MGSHVERAKVLSIAKLLRDDFGNHRPARREEPVGELIRTVLSQNTSDANSARAYDNLRRGFKDWEGLRKAGTRRIARYIRMAGLANVNAPRIKGALNEIRRRAGSLNLSFLAGLDAAVGYRFLRTIKGVGPKTAACVLLFSFGKPVMPVDTHIFRVGKRLGLLDEGRTHEEAQEYLSEVVPAAMIYEFHINLISHGRQVCAARNPRCRICSLKRACKYYKDVVTRPRSFGASGSLH